MLEDDSFVNGLSLGFEAEVAGVWKNAVVKTPGLDLEAEPEDVTELFGSHDQPLTGNDLFHT